MATSLATRLRMLAAVRHMPIGPFPTEYLVWALYVIAAAAGVN